MVAFLGMGLLGSNFVKALLDKGYAVRVWNRTHEKAVVMQQFGATAFESCAEAVIGVARVHLALKDDAAVDSVLEQVASSLPSGCLIIDHTTTSASGAAKRTAIWAEKGFTFLHAPVFMGPQNARESTGVMLVSGEDEVIEKVRPLLQELTGKVLHFGNKAGTAAGMKLIGNLFLIAITAGVVDSLALAKSLDIDVADVKKLFEVWNPAGIMAARLQKITSGTFDQPTWELNMARKDARLMNEQADAAQIPLMVIPAVTGVMDALIEAGFGSYDWTVIGKNAL